MLPDKKQLAKANTPKGAGFTEIDYNIMAMLMGMHENNIIETLAAAGYSKKRVMKILGYDL